MLPIASTAARRASGSEYSTLIRAVWECTRVGPRALFFAKTLLESGRLALAEKDRSRARRELAAAEPILLAHVPPTHESIREIHRLLAQAGR